MSNVTDLLKQANELSIYDLRLLHDNILEMLKIKRTAQSLIDKVNWKVGDRFMMISKRGTREEFEITDIRKVNAIFKLAGTSKYYRAKFAYLSEKAEKIGFPDDQKSTVPRKKRV
jgi:hypothetical protein